ncbi:MAG: helix-turn-helix domain-containing protein [Proteobacteria bacterium]|nr:helix-turn-helix domain-containing protein [Pseudomonadota bacterium]
MRLRLAGSSLAQVARELGVQPTTVTSVCLGQRRSRRIDDRIAEILRTTPAKLWPDRYPDRDAAAAGASRRTHAGGIPPRTAPC